MKEISLEEDFVVLMKTDVDTDVNLICVTFQKISG